MSNKVSETKNFLSHAGLHLNELQMSSIIRAMTHFPKAYKFYLDRNGKKNTTIYCAGKVSIVRVYIYIYIRPQADLRRGEEGMCGGGGETRTHMFLPSDRREAS